MEPGKSYHIYTHANGSENLFRNAENFRYFLSRCNVFLSGVAYMPVYCLMPNHLHLLVRIKSELELKEYFSIKKKKVLTGLAEANNEDLSGLNELQRLTILQFSHLFNAYSKAYNKVYSRKGSLFTRAFNRKEITSDSYFTRIIHYIHHNPVHHGFVKQLSDWPWSSYHELLLPQLSPVQQEVIDWFGNREQFILFHHQALGATPEITEHD